jgi:wyosine [tRNA(Phe)-imidazoG37] synthetase (radical SAM superfamily)
MDLKNIRCLSPDERSAKCKLFVIKVAKCKQSSFFYFHTKCWNHCTYCQLAKQTKDGTGNLPMSNILKTLTGHQK